jgi:hypothetical protein
MTDNKDTELTSQGMGPKIYHIIRGNLIAEKSTQFYDGDTYVIDNGMEIFIWMGKNTSVDEEFAGAYMSEQIDMARRGAPKVTSVDQGKEPKKLLDLLGPNFKVVAGSTGSMLKKVEPEKELTPTLYRCVDDKPSKIQLKRSALDSHECVILDMPKTIFVWEGKDSTAKDKYAAGHLARELNSKRKFMVPIKVVVEGEETDEFLSPLK